MYYLLIAIAISSRLLEEPEREPSPRGSVTLLFDKDRVCNTLEHTDNFERIDIAERLLRGNEKTAWIRKHFGQRGLGLDVWDELEIEKETQIFEGRFGKVAKALLLCGEKYRSVAIKVPRDKPFADVDTAESITEEFHKEIEMNLKFSKPQHVVTASAVSFFPESIYLMFPWMSEGAADLYFKARKYMDIDTFFSQLMSGLKEMKEAGVLSSRSDIALRNILISGDDIKISDLGEIPNDGQTNALFMPVTLKIKEICRELMSLDIEISQADQLKYMKLAQIVAKEENNRESNEAIERLIESISYLKKLKEELERPINNQQNIPDSIIEEEETFDMEDLLGF